jgi:hypothetical protein
MGVLALGLAACTPAFNWREARHEGVPLRALMPCKPDRADREVPLLGAGEPLVTLRMLSCGSAGVTFAVAVVRLPADADAPAAMGRWREATWASLKQAVPASGGDAVPPGWVMRELAVPGAGQTQAWQGPALAHDGQPLQAWVLLTARGEWLVQAAAYGKAVQDDTLDTFFGAIGFQ